MAQHPDDGLKELRRRAYSRSGTADDLRRLAELETPKEPEAIPEPVAVDELAVPEEPEPVEEHRPPVATPSHPALRRRRTGGRRDARDPRHPAPARW